MRAVAEVLACIVPNSYLVRICGELSVGCGRVLALMQAVAYTTLTA